MFMSLLYQFTVNDQFPVLVVELKELEGSPLLYDDFILSAEIGLRADSVASPDNTMPKEVNFTANLKIIIINI